MNTPDRMRGSGTPVNTGGGVASRVAPGGTLSGFVSADTSPFPCASYIKTIGRGARGSRGLSTDEAHTLYAAILDGRVSDLELGAVLLCYRIKSEEPAELSGMMAAVQARLQRVRAPEGKTPIVLASYNGARKQANLLPLLAHLLARQGVPVLVHGYLDMGTRVTSAHVFAALGQAPCTDVPAIEAALRDTGVAFTPIDTLSPALGRQLALNEPLGVRNSAHTLAKLIQPFTTPALRWVNYTHQAYRDVLVDYFNNVDVPEAPGVVISRGTEGEAVADTTLPRQVEHLAAGQSHVVMSEGEGPKAAAPLGEAVDAVATAAFIRAVLDGEQPVPPAIAAQVALIVATVGGNVSAPSAG